MTTANAQYRAALGRFAGARVDAASFWSRDRDAERAAPWVALDLAQQVVNAESAMLEIAILAVMAWGHRLDACEIRRYPDARAVLVVRGVEVFQVATATMFTGFMITVTPRALAWPPPLSSEHGIPLDATLG